MSTLQKAAARESIKIAQAAAKANDYVAQRENLKKAQAALLAMGNPGLKKAQDASRNSERQKDAARKNVKRAQEENTIHGLSKHPLYRTWHGMMWRCSDAVTGTNRKHYFERGIRVCERWHDVANFIADIGPKPGPGWSLDRINPDGDYSPENCRWATFRDQIHNRGKAHGDPPRPTVVLRWRCGGPSFRRSLQGAVKCRNCGSNEIGEET